MAEKQVLLTCLLMLAKQQIGATESLIPHSPPPKGKQDCFKPASSFLVLFIPLVTLHFGLSEYWQWECSWITWNELMHHSCQLGMILDKMYGIDEKGISVSFLWRWLASYKTVPSIYCHQLRQKRIRYINWLS